MKAVLIDDHALFRDGLEGLLKRRGVEVQACSNGLDGIEALILQGIGAELVDQPDSPALLSEIEQDTGAFPADLGDRAAQLLAAIAFQ
jgi:DNA-binding NarL/FixJ family response regulator